MRLTIIVDDSCLYIDGINKGVLDLSACEIPSDVHALQWQESFGWIEFKNNSNGSKPRNQTINNLPEWANNCLKVLENS